ncbi:MAG TPA: tetratricopeptide repeat protein, partial [Ktedonobacteraceae bacterium]|nr:tetratricopeptide repeat protein [Ktedonobacteraceae bacterium]
MIPARSLPNLPRIIARPRLLAKLQAALQYRLTLISAPPGYGKTTLAAQFVLNISYPTAWHTIEERDRDLPILHSTALDALSYIAPEIKSLASSQGYTPTENVALISDYLRDNVADDFLYIVDDVHLLTGSPAAESWLQALVTLMPGNCHLILISRSLPSLPLAEMIGRGQVQAIGETDLSLTLDEVRELGKLNVDQIMSEVEIENLFNRLAGWPAGTVLAIQPLPTEIARASLSGGEGPEALFDALATAMLAAQPPRIRDFLLTSSTLSRLNPEALSAAFGITKVANLLAEIQSRNLFVVHAPGGMFYHLLLRRFLQKQLKETDPGQFALLHSQAAAWYEAQDQLDSALDHYLIAEQLAQASEIAARTAHACFAQGKWETLLKWNSRLRDVGASIPSLLYCCALIYSDRYDYEAAQRCLSEAENSLSPHDSRPGLADIEIQRGMIRLQQGAYQEAADRVAQFVKYPPGLDNVRGRALRILGYAQMRLGNIETAAIYLEEAVPLHREDGDSHALGNVLQDLGVVYARLGHLDDALGCLQEVIALRRSLGSPITLAQALNNLGYYYHRSGNYERAGKTLQEGLA